MTRIATRLAATVLSVVALHSQTPGPPSAPPSPRAGLVIVHATVEPIAGAAPQRLTQGDFRILADGRPRPIEFFSAADEPVSVVLLIDTSISFRNRFGALLLQSAIDRSFLPGLTSRDRLSVGGFGGRVTFATPLTTQRQAILDALRATLLSTSDDQYGPSPAWDAIDGAVAMLEREAGRKAIVLITDGRSTGNRVSYRDAATRAMAAGVLLHIVAKDTEDVVFRVGTGLARSYEAEQALRVLADQTGGSFRVDNRPRVAGDRLANIAFDRLLARSTSMLHRMYTLGFAPDASEARAHTLDVQSLNPNVTARARQGYFTGGS